MKKELLKLAKHLRAIGYEQEAKYAQDISMSTSEDLDAEDDSEKSFIIGILTEYCDEDKQNNAYDELEKLFASRELDDEFFESIFNILSENGCEG
jgi:hypothetical protein